MFKILILLIAVFVIVIILRKRGSEKIETEVKDIPITYVCTECGLKDCNCYKDSKTHKQ
jgi:hypothetical protein